MSYTKPIIVAKSAAKRSFVAGCPTKSIGCGQGNTDSCGKFNNNCAIPSTK